MPRQARCCDSRRPRFWALYSKGGRTWPLCILCAHWPVHYIQNCVQTLLIAYSVRGGGGGGPRLWLLGIRQLCALTISCLKTKLHRLKVANLWNSSPTGEGTDIIEKAKIWCTDCTFRVFYTKCVTSALYGGPVLKHKCNHCSPVWLPRWVGVKHMGGVKGSN